MAAYTITDLANALGLNTSGFRVDITSTAYVGLVADEFIIHHSDETEERVSPKDIVARCEEIINQAFVVSDNRLYDLCQERADAELDEDSFFEMELGDDPVLTMNTWLSENDINIHVVRCVEKNDNVSWELA